MPGAKVSDTIRLTMELLSVLVSPKKFDYVILRCLGPIYSGWSITGAMKRVLRLLLYLVAVKHKLQKSRLAILDHTDHVTIHRADKKLLKLCDIYFKRELARNAWNTFECVLPRGRCIEHATENLFGYHQLTTKLRPISLGIHTGINDIRHERKYDFFYAGLDRGIYERMEIRYALQTMKEMGYRVFLPREMMTQEEFAEAIASTWFCPSPMGCGWDCYRHYEIIANGSLPLLSAPAIKAYHPPGCHNDTGISLDYEGDLMAQLIDCLSIPVEYRLEMIGNAQNLVKAHHTFPALGDYMVHQVEELIDAETVTVAEPAAVRPRKFSTIG